MSQANDIRRGRHCVLFGLCDEISPQSVRWQRQQPAAYHVRQNLRRLRGATDRGGCVQATVPWRLPAAMNGKLCQDNRSPHLNRLVQTTYLVHHQTCRRPEHNSDHRKDAGIHSRPEVLLPAGANTKIWTRGYATDSGLSSSGMAYWNDGIQPSPQL